MKAAEATIEVTLTTAMRLLIIEDERRTAAHLQKGLTKNGFAVDVAYDGFEGFEFARTGDYALIVLDVMLPHRDGWTILDELRRASVMTPVLFLTARDRVEDRIKGLEMGADDYLVKPYSFSELLARVRTVLRRGPAKQEEVLRIADLEIDTRRYRVVRQGRTLQLTRREFLLLTCLARSAGEVVSRTRIVEQVWDINFDTGTNIVEATMRRLTIPSKSHSFTTCAALVMSSNAGKNGATVVGRPSRPWSLFARLAAFYTLGLTALILVTMVILYSVLVQRKASNIDLWRKMVFVDVGARRT